MDFLLIIPMELSQISTIQNLGSLDMLGLFQEWESLNPRWKKTSSSHVFHGHQMAIKSMRPPLCSFSPLRCLALEDDWLVVDLPL